MATKPTTAPVVKAKNEVAVSGAVPDFMAKYAGQGTEKLGPADVEVPRVKLLQGTSPEVEEFESAKPGAFWHTMTQGSLGKEIMICPIYIDQRAILWRPRDDGGGILARADDGIHWSPANATFAVKIGKKPHQKDVVWKTRPTVVGSGLLEWGSSDPDDAASQPAATKMYNMVCSFPDNPDVPPAVITLQRASIRVARKFLGQIKMARAPSFGMKFMMSSWVDNGAGGDKFQNYKFAPMGFVQDQDTFAQNQGLYEAFKAMGLKINDLEGVQDDFVGADASDDTDRSSY